MSDLPDERNDDLVKHSPNDAVTSVKIHKAVIVSPPLRQETTTEVATASKPETTTTTTTTTTAETNSKGTASTGQAQSSTSENKASLVTTAAAICDNKITAKDDAKEASNGGKGVVTVVEGKAQTAVSSSFTKVLHPHDVLFAETYINWPGNLHLQKRIDERRHRFSLASKISAQTAVVREIIELVKSRNPRGRFLEQSAEDDDEWCCLEETDIFVELGQRLRSPPPTTGQQQHDGGGATTTTVSQQQQHPSSEYLQNLYLTKVYPSDYSNSSYPQPIIPTTAATSASNKKRKQPETSTTTSSSPDGGASDSSTVESSPAAGKQHSPIRQNTNNNNINAPGNHWTLPSPSRQFDPGNSLTSPSRQPYGPFPARQQQHNIQQSPRYPATGNAAASGGSTANKKPAAKKTYTKQNKGRQTSNQSQGGKKVNEDLPKGVTMRPSGKWQAQIYFCGQSRYIGVFQDAHCAASAYWLCKEKLGKNRSQPFNKVEASEMFDKIRKSAEEVIRQKGALLKEIYKPKPKA